VSSPATELHYIAAPVRPCPSTIKAVGTTAVCALSRSDIVRALADDPTGLVDLLCALSAQMHSRLDDTGGVSDVERLLKDLTRESLADRPDVLRRAGCRHDSLPHARAGDGCGGSAATRACVADAEHRLGSQTARPRAQRVRSSS